MAIMVDYIFKTSIDSFDERIELTLLLGNFMPFIDDNNILIFNLLELSNDPTMYENLHLITTSAIANEFGDYCNSQKNDLYVSSTVFEFGDSCAVVNEDDYEDDNDDDDMENRKRYRGIIEIASHADKTGKYTAYYIVLVDRLKQDNLEQKYVIITNENANKNDETDEYYQQFEINLFRKLGCVCDDVHYNCSEILAYNYNKYMPADEDKLLNHLLSVMNRDKVNKHRMEMVIALCYKWQLSETLYEIIYTFIYDKELMRKNLEFKRY